MKMSKLFGVLSVAFATLVGAGVARASTGDIVDIRLVDQEGMVYNSARNGGNPYLCSAERPMKAGDTLYIRVRMLVKNYTGVIKFGEAPKEWWPKPNTPAASFLNVPAIALYMGEGRQPAKASFVEYGPTMNHKSGTLLTDDLFRAPPESNPDGWKYYTDLYFAYTVKPGDLGMPIRLMTAGGPTPDEDTDSNYQLYNCALNGATTGLEPWVLSDTEGTPASFWYGPGLESLQGVEWPEGDQTTKGPIRNYDLMSEGGYVKTVDFDSNDPEAGGYWREVPAKGGEPDNAARLEVLGGYRDEPTIVYVWTTNEAKAVVFAKNSSQAFDETTRKLRITIPAGETPTVDFGLRSGAEAEEGDKVDVFLGAVNAALASGEELVTKVTRQVVIGAAREPTVKVYLDAKGTVNVTDEAVPDYQTPSAHELVFRCEPVCTTGDIVLKLKAKVTNDDTLQTLQDLYADNILRLTPKGFAGDPLDQEPTEITIPKGTSEVRYQVHLLGATDKTQKNGVIFSLEEKTVPAGVKVDDQSNAKFIIKKTFKPVIVAATPEFATDEQEGRVTVGSGNEKAFVLEIQDTYRNLNDANGYDFIFKAEGEEGVDENDDPTPGVITVFGVTVNDEGRFSTDDVDQNPVFYGIAPEGKEMTLQLKAPNGTKGEAVKYLLVVTDGKYTTIARTEEKIVFCEGESTHVTLGLTQGYTGNSGHIFLADAGDDESVTNWVYSPQFQTGASIERGKTKVEAEREIRFLDGGKDLTLKAVLCSQNDKTKTVESYGAGTIVFTITNKPPSVVSVKAGDYDVDMAKGTIAEPICRGVKKLFTVVVDDVDPDLYAKGADAMKVKWEIDGSTYETNDVTKSFEVAHTFTAEKVGAVVKIFVKDKDMSAYPLTPTYTFKVDVKDMPKVEITPSATGGRFSENETSTATIKLALSEAAKDDVTVRIQIPKASDGGFLKLRELEDVVRVEGSEYEYDVSFRAGEPQKTLVVSEMDGSYGTGGGIFMSAWVTTGKEYQGVAWSNYYQKASGVMVRVMNVAPEILRPTQEAAATTNMNASANTPYKVQFGVNDVSNDFAAAWTDRGKSVQGVNFDISVDDTSVTNGYLTTKDVQEYAVEFEGEGTHYVTFSFIDKDGDSSSRTLYYYVKPSKRLQLRAHGPALSVASTGGYSQHYGLAAGLGAGRVFAGENGPQKVANFVHSYSFNEVETVVSAYAAGYKADGSYDDGSLGLVSDKAIDANGNWSKGESPAKEKCYNYTLQHPWGKLGYDSFLYGWACNNTSTSTESGGGSDATTTTMSFLLNIGPAGEANLPFPASNDGNKGGTGASNAPVTYPVQYWEAVFSREWLKADNCGDINQDGVPDAAVYTFGMDVVDGSGKLLMAGTGGGGGEGTTLPEGDLTNLSEWNKDLDKDGAEAPDFLPNTETAQYAELIPGMKETWVDLGQPFGAKLEIRGYGDGLNDAAMLLGLGSDIESDRIYATTNAAGEWAWSADCTISHLEFLAWQEYAAANNLVWTNAADWTKWSPERPTKPTLNDTDGDEFSDGYEYYFWYKAHVGYIDENGVHRYLTGRRYDPRNPGEGQFLSSAWIARTMDPRSDLPPVDMPEGFFEDASKAETRDTDNDGLPDLLEFEIGTNPFDFDTDGDGLPDGFEILLNGTDPLLAYTTKGIADGMRNYDGDAMAFTTPKLEEGVLPTPLEIKQWVSFATMTEAFDGDTDGIQWYVGRDFTHTNFTYETEEGKVFQVGGRRYFTKASVSVTDDGRLATDLSRDAFGKPMAFAVIFGKELADACKRTGLAGVTTDYLRLAPTVLTAGTQLDSIKHEITVPAEEEGGEASTAMVDDWFVDASNTVVRFAAEVAGKPAVEHASSAWVYGRDTVSTETGANAMLSQGGFGMLMLGRYLDIPDGAILVELPDLNVPEKEKRTVALAHYLVYEEFGFDPRTAWNAHTPLAARWGSTVDGEAVESMFNGNNGYAGVATRTREFTAYDEFLLLSFFLNNGKIALGDVTASQANPWATIWSKYTTNPQGPGELWDPDDENYKGRTAETASDTNGADTDRDGVPDGWELYVMAGPKQNVKPYGLVYNFAGPYNDNHWSHFGPFEGDAASASWTDASGTSGYGSTPGDNDGLTELREFAGTDSCNWYSQPQEGNTVAFSTTIVRPETDAKWLNKFFPTDPWTADTDGDGIDDGWEIRNYFLNQTTAEFKCGNFIYGTPVDNGSTSIPGGGLNPLTIDTDGDGLPDLWEAQFAGSKIYDGPQVQLTKDADGNEGNPKQGLCDGMDGTVADAYSTPVVYDETAPGETNITWWLGAENTYVNRDYDHDGLENWQEYMTGLMRCWRYDDPLSPWGAVDDSLFYTDGEFDVQKAASILFPGDPDGINRFWYETLVNTQGDYYNPFLLSGMSPANYLTRVKNGWDKAYPVATASDPRPARYYWLPGRIGDTTIDDLWCNSEAKKHLPVAEGMSTHPFKYACCSPIEADSDHDGMDDYYELFHGMNPLLGASGQVNKSYGGPLTLQSNVGPCDLVYDAWYTEGAKALEAWAPTADAATANYWQRDKDLAAKRKARFAKRGLAEVANGYDFEVYPWLNGLQTADPDGDDIRNLWESIQPKLSDDFYLHTDPTPLWMTDSTYSNSLVRLFFRLPERSKKVNLDESFTYNGQTWFFRDFDGYVPPMGMAPAYFNTFAPDQWSLKGADSYNWMYSFEENEGFDTDHDAVGDYEEAQGSKHSASDAQDFDSPRRRQALYFPDSAEKPGLVVSMPEEAELHPLGASLYPSEDAFLNYTVELWVKPNRTDVDQTVFERAIWVDKSKTADKEYMRKGFQIAIKGGKWYTKYDTNGTDPTDTLSGKTFECMADVAAKTDWTHIAVRYDGTMLTLYVNGTGKSVAAHLAPANDSSALVFRSDKGHFGEYWYSRKHKYAAFVFGASVKGRMEAGDEAYKALDPTEGVGLGYYKDFFRGGYIDEVRVWDGARDADDIIADYESRKRYDRADALENRSAVYKAWKDGKKVPELRHHWSFDSVPGAENAEQVAKWPHGFQENDGPVMSRPEGYEISWWKKTAKAYGSVYAGFYDWVTWIPDTVAHLPHYDGTTLDSVFWSSGYAGDVAGTYVFPMTSEPVSRWSQMTYGGVIDVYRYWSTATRHRFLNELHFNDGGSTLWKQFEFAGRNRVQTGNDLLPLGGAFVKYVETMWDDQGASSVWEQTGDDADANGLPDWWEAYADQNYRPDGLPPGTPIGWNTVVVVDGIKMTAGEAYLRDLAKGMYVGSDGKWHAGPTVYAQTAKADGLIPDWWKDLYKINGAEPLFDSDNDGLNNYIEYLASETLPFGLRLNPLEARSDTATLDYFRKVGKLYLGEMLTDHDQMEDHWERSLGDATVADATVWDALKDADADGWTNFAENRYNGMRVSTLAQLVSHAMGDVEALDAPMPSIKLTVRYNGRHVTAGEAKEGEDETKPDLVVKTFTAAEPASPDATFVLKPGTEVERELYVGGWEDRVIRGTLAPGNIDIGSLTIMFAQVPQSDKYSWTDESGLHLTGTYEEFKEALDRNPDIVQNLQNFQWLQLAEPVVGYEGISSDKAVTIARDELTQLGYIAVYGERVGTIDLTTGDFEFDLSAMSKIRPQDKNGVGYTFASDERAAWSYKEAIFKFSYRAKIPALDENRMLVSLAQADKGFVKGGKNTIMAFFDNDADGNYTPGEPFGVLKDVEIGWWGRNLEMELTDMSGVTPRVDLWTGNSDRTERWGASDVSNRIVAAKAASDLVRVRVARYKVDGTEVNTIGVEPRVLLDRTFDREAATFLHEGDFLGDGSFDVDWNTLLPDVSNLDLQSYMLTNVTYLVVLGDGPSGYKFTLPGKEDTNAVITALSTVIERRFEATRSAPTPALERCVFTKASPTFAWKLDKEDKVYAARYGTTYTAFKVVVKSGGTTVYDSGYNRMPACDAGGVYRWTAPLYVGSASPSHPTVKFENFKNYTWQVFVYNAKFKTDANGSASQEFRMNVTTVDTSSQAINVGVTYSGPATKLAGKVRVQAFTSPDFTGDPVAEVTVDGNADKVKLIGLPAGSYFVRAYIDTNGNGVRDEWESWGYLCERDRATKAGIFNPVSLEAKFNPNEKDVRMVYIEDCDTDGDLFPDAWEAELNGGEFVPFKSGNGQGPASGTRELHGVNTNLDATVNESAAALLTNVRRALSSPAGVSLMTGIDPADIEVTDGGLQVKSEVDPETLTITGFAVDAANKRVLLKVGAETTANVDAAVANFLNVRVQKGSEVTVKVEHAASPAGPWTVVKNADGTDVGGTVTVDKAGTDVKVNLNGELPAQGFFRVKIEE